jgi:hypothetical protein
VGSQVEKSADDPPRPLGYPTGTPPWMWLVREALNSRYTARILWALFAGALLLIQTCRG